MAEYGDLHRSFIQAMLAKGVMNKADTLNVLKKILEELECEFDPNDRRALINMTNGIVQKLNRKIRSLGMEIRRCRCERTGTMSYVLVNTVASAASISAFKDYSPEEMEYFKVVLSTMFNEEERALNYRQCLNLTTRSAKRISMDDGEKFLERMIADKWLEKVDGVIRLHVRAIQELEPYLKEKYDLRECLICKTIVTVAKNQECPECNGQAHWFCIARQPRRQCPNEECLAVWPEAEQSQASTSSSTSQRASFATSTTHKRVQMADDSSGNEDAEESTSTAQKKKRQQPDE